MEKIIHYEIEGRIVASVRTILAKISDVDMVGTYNLNTQEIKDIHTYLDNSDVDES